MINYIWISMILGGICISFFTGNVEAVSETILYSCQSAVELCIGLLGIYALWMGLMKIAKESGLVEKLSYMLRPVLCRLFPSVPSSSTAMGFISLNMIANMLGMGNAATPFGLKAMEQMQKYNKTPDIATDDMCMFLIINASSVQIIPTTVIALRQAMGSASAAQITAAALFATCCSTIVGIAAAVALRRRRS